MSKNIRKTASVVATATKAAAPTPATAKGAARAAKGAAKAAPAATPAKVGKLDKAAKSAPVKGQQGQQGQQASAPRGQYAGKKITVTEAGRKASIRGNRAARWEIVSKAKNTNDVLGLAYTRADGEEGTITSSGLRNFVDRGFITLT